jgi:hypothetical protein
VRWQPGVVKFDPPINRTDYFPVVSLAVHCWLTGGSSYGVKYQHLHRGRLITCEMFNRNALVHVTWVNVAWIIVGVGFIVRRLSDRGRGVDHPSPSSARVKERVGLYLHSAIWDFMTCSRVNFTFIWSIAPVSLFCTSAVLLFATDCSGEIKLAASKV